MMPNCAAVLSSRRLARRQVKTPAMRTRIAVAIVVLLSLSACASLQDAAKCKSNERLAVQDTLYFGTGKPNGVVTREEWARFLEAIVTPRFPQGLTVS